MNRMALIICNPGEVGSQDYCKGVIVDVEKYKSFLTSAAGGGWYDDEIITLERPDASQVRRWIFEMRNIDYTLIIFSGHGCSTGDDTILELKNGEYINSDELKKYSNKRIIILDCCRKIVNSLNESLYFEHAARIEKSTSDKILARRYYDSIIQNCDVGIVVLYSCSLDEYSYDDEKLGGYYSYSLLKNASSWYNKQFVKNYLSIGAAHELAKNTTIVKSGDKQHPTISKPRTAILFPFVVKV